MLDLLQCGLPDKIARKLNTRQLLMLQLIRDEPGVTQKEIAKFLEITPPSASVALRQLEQLGLIERRLDAHDGRLLHLYPTKTLEDGDPARLAGVHFNILALGFLGGRTEACPYNRPRAAAA
jgi:hypothetical protein